MNTIDYIEFWATKHCNLNCRGCSSCSPISKEWYLDPEKLQQDLVRLRDLDIKVNNINILGGEPLLHPYLVDLLDVVKNVYPQCNLGILTNGLLLHKMGPLFWSKCIEHSIKIKITWFPVTTEEDITKLEEDLKKRGIDYHITRKTKFNKILVENNKSSMESIVRACGCNNAYNLYDGCVSRCTVPMVVGAFNDYFGARLIDCGRLNIYEATTEEVLDFLSKPNQSCMNCSAHPQKVFWEKAEKRPSKNDWIIEE